jgi:serine/threonine protein phosphatase 1
MGDIHGNFKGMIQALQRSGFDYKNDLLIILGDVADGWSETPEVVEELMKIMLLRWILGNHDKWTQDWMAGRMNMNGVGLDGHPMSVAWGEANISHEAHEWLEQGGRATFTAYMKEPSLITKHRQFWLEKPVLYYLLDDGKKCFVHGGFNRSLLIEEQAQRSPYLLYWDRELWNKALCVHGSGLKLTTQDNFDEIYIGHTATVNWDTTHPMNSGGVWNLDTGGGWGGCVTIMDIDTKQYWQSDLCKDLYHDEKGRR